MRRRLRKLVKSIHIPQEALQNANAERDLEYLTQKAINKAYKSDNLFTINKSPSAGGQIFLEKLKSAPLKSRNESKLINKFAKKLPNNKKDEIVSIQNILVPSDDIWKEEHQSLRKTYTTDQPAVPLPLSGQSYNPSVEAHNFLMEHVALSFDKKESTSEEKAKMEHRKKERHKFFLMRDNLRRRLRKLNLTDQLTMSIARKKKQLRDAEHIEQFKNKIKNREIKLEKQRQFSRARIDKFKKNVEVGLAFCAPKRSKHRLEHKSPDLQLQEDLPKKFSNISSSQRENARERFDVLFRRGQLEYINPRKAFRKSFKVEKKRGTATILEN